MKAKTELKKLAMELAIDDAIQCLKWLADKHHAAAGNGKESIEREIGDAVWAIASKVRAITNQVDKA